MTAQEIYDKFFADEEYDLENAPSELYSYRSGWNTALKRASIVIRNEIRPQGEWIKIDDIPIDGYKKCSNCNTGAEWLDGGSQFLSNFCPNCGARMKVVQR